ncbi:MAG: hypothetical protein ACWGMZ_10015, partial [Thermoguttaceae bacterium]
AELSRVRRMARENIFAEMNRSIRKHRLIGSKESGWGEVFDVVSGEPQEISSGAFWPDPKRPGCYCIDANTASGLHRFNYAREETQWADAQSQEDSDLIAVEEFWSPLKSPSEIKKLVGAWRKSATETRSQLLSEVELLEDGLAPDALLQTLESNTASHEEKRRAIVESEVVAFPSESNETLSELLYQFIQQHRDSDNQEDIIAVGCAIRKYVTVMNHNHLSRLAVLLDAQHNATVPIEVELEITKTLVRKLSQIPPGKPDSEAQLADRLYEIVKLYLNSRLLARDKFAAVALNAILSLCMLRSDYAERVQKSLRALQLSWFTELVSRRAVQILEVLKKTFSAEQAAHFGEQLISLSKESTICNR